MSENALENKPVSTGTLLSAMFLVAGTCIGGGMLALPVATGFSGYIPSFLIMAISWLMMTITALLLMEACLWMEEGVHVITLTSRLLGNGAKWVAWVLFLFISYASLVAYGAAGGLQISSSFNYIFDTVLSPEMGVLIFILFGLTFYLGNRVVGRVNSILFIAMCLAYVALVGMGVSEVNPSYLLHQRWSTSLMALPLLLTAFSFQTMVPSLAPYLKRNAPYLKKAIVWGTSIAFFVYMIWQTILLGIIPVDGELGLTQLLIQGIPATEFLGQHVQSLHLALVAKYFAFFALATSFLGIGLGLYDFLADGLNIKEKGWGSVILSALVIVPTYLFATNFERIFLIALDLTGGIGDTILNGIIPCLLVWVGRYKLGYKGVRFIPGGKKTLSLILLFYVITLFFVILMQFGLITSIFNVHETLGLE